MSETPVTAANGKLESLLSSLLDAGIGALEELVGQSVKGHLGGLESVDPQSLLSDIDAHHAVVLGALDQAFEGQAMRVVLPASEATALSGYVKMNPEETIEERRQKGTLEGEELETFAEVANVLCSGFDAVLRESVDDVVLRAQDCGLITPGTDEKKILGSEPLVACSFDIAIGNHPEARGWLLLEPQTAERWNGQPLSTGDAAAGEAEEDIPAAPIRGQLSAYLCDPDVLEPLRKSCRRVGLELHRHSRTEVPNPAEHRDDIVLMDVPSGDTRRFEWCKRLKLYHPGVKVALLIQHPSRSRVLKGFLAKADAIMAWPITERELSEKLDALLAPPADGEQ